MSGEELEDKCYDTFNIDMKQLQILMAKPGTTMLYAKTTCITFLAIDLLSTLFKGEDWRSVRNEEKSKLHLLYPFGIEVQLQKSLAPDDVRLTQYVQVFSLY